LYKNTFWQLYFLSQAGLSLRLGKVDRSIGLVVETMQKEDGSFPSTSRYRGGVALHAGHGAGNTYQTGLRV